MYQLSNGQGANEDYTLVDYTTNDSTIAMMNWLNQLNSTISNPIVFLIT